MFCSMARYLSFPRYIKKEKRCAYISLYKRRNNYTRYPLFGSSDFRRLTSVTFFCLHYIIQSKIMNITIKKVCTTQTQNCSKLVPSPKYPTFFLYEMGNYSEVFQLLLILYTFLCRLIIFFKKLFDDFPCLFIKFNTWWHTVYLRHYFFFHIWISF